jgi:hypothetical protein
MRGQKKGENKGMARFNPVHKELKLLPEDLDKRIQPGSFEHDRCY